MQYSDLRENQIMKHGNTILSFRDAEPKFIQTHLGVILNIWLYDAMQPKN